VLAFEDDLRVAAELEVPVLISGPVSASGQIAGELHRRSGAAGEFEILDCRAGSTLVPRQIRDWTRDLPGRHTATRQRTVLLQEIHALPSTDQAALAQQLELQVVRNPSAVRIISSSSVSLFDQVVNRAFDERLYYRLNIIHLVAPQGANSAVQAR
jgi:DNA-binding NtrC family response regulator